jgi:hypothetical protein
MRKVTLLLAAFVAISGVAMVQADAQATEEAQLGIGMDVSYLSRNLFYGIDLYPKNDPKISTSVALDLWGTGFSAIVAGNWSIQGGQENAEKYDYILAYSGVLMEDDVLQTNYVLNWGYYDFYDGPSKAIDQQELGALFAFPNLCGDSGVVPHYRVVKLWNASSNHTNRNLSGWVHVFGFDYGFNMACPAREDTEQPFNFTFDIVYNDGYVITESDWSHANFTLAAPMECPMGGSITPSVTYQMTMENSVNPKDEIVLGVNYHYNF